MSHPLSKTVLKNRTLWFDGDTSYPAGDIQKALLSLSITDQQLFVDQLTDDIKQYNNFVSPDKQVHVKTENRRFNFQWIIPEEYKNLNLVDYVTDHLIADHEAKKFPDDQLINRVNRVSQELNLYKKHGLDDVLRVLIFIINTLTSQGVVWGVGRGSSVSSYVLYLIGVHDVDSVKYELSITDFLH